MSCSEKSSLDPVDRCTTPPPKSCGLPKLQQTPKRGETNVYPYPASPSKLFYQPIRSGILDSAHRLLKKMAEENRDNPPCERDVQQIKEISRKLIDQRNPKDLLTFMKLLSQFMIFDSKEIFFDVLRAFRTLEPRIDPFFVDYVTDESYTEPSLTPHALNTMFEIYERYYNFPNGILSSQPVSSLPALVGKIIASDHDQIRGFVINNDLDPLDPHVVPVFVIKYMGKTHLFIFDSLGHVICATESERSISCSLSYLIQQFQNRKDLSELFAVYSYKIKRQSSEIGCATFSLLDLKKLLERHLNSTVNIVDFYMSQASEHLPRRIDQYLGEGIDFPIYELDILPFEMMEVTQSVTKISDYQRNPPRPAGESPIFRRFSPDGTLHGAPQDFGAFKEKMKEIIRVTRDEKDVNLYVDQKRLGDIVLLINHYMDWDDSEIRRKVGGVARCFFSGDS